MVKVSIVITNYNGQKLLRKHLPAVVRACRNWGKSSWEIVVVDDASTDGSVAFLRKNYPEIRVVIHKANQRFAATCNSGVKAARGKIVVLLNNDVSPNPDFLKPLVANFSDPAVFAVGCKERDEQDGRLVWSGRGIMKFKRGLAVHWRAEDQNKKTNCWATAGSAAYNREKWLKIGGMDTLFRPAYEEDRDISYRALKHGWKVLFEPKSIVHHHHETTNIRAFGRREIQIVSFKNQFLFVWKNITDWPYLLAHLFWLPYHLLWTNFRTCGQLGQGFLRALRQLPEFLVARRKVKTWFVKKDRELI